MLGIQRQIQEAQLKALYRFSRNSDRHLRGEWEEWEFLETSAYPEATATVDKE